MSPASAIAVKRSKLTVCHMGFERAKAKGDRQEADKWLKQMRIVKQELDQLTATSKE